MAIRKLNNFVTELFEADLKYADFVFENPREGWVHLSMSKALWKVVGKLDGSTAATIGYRLPPAGEAVRLLAAGKHTLTMSSTATANPAGVKLRARAIKPVLVDARALTKLRGEMDGLDGWRQHAVASITSACIVPAADDPLSAVFEAEFVRRGIKLVSSAELPPAELGPLAYREGGKWHRLETTDEALRRLATDPAHAVVEAIAFLPVAGDLEMFKRVFAALRRYAVKGETTAPAAK